MNLETYTEWREVLNFLRKYGWEPGDGKDEMNIAIYRMCEADIGTAAMLTHKRLLEASMDGEKDLLDGWEEALLGGQPRRGDREQQESDQGGVRDQDQGQGEFLVELPVPCPQEEGEEQGSDEMQGVEEGGGEVIPLDDGRVKEQSL